MPMLRTTSGPCSHPAHTGANQASPASIVRTPIRREPQSAVARPASPRAAPVAIVSAAARPEPPAYVVIRPGPCATASAPQHDAATASPSTTQAARVHRARVWSSPWVRIEVIVGPRTPPASPCWPQVGLAVATMSRPPAAPLRSPRVRRATPRKGEDHARHDAATSPGDRLCRRRRMALWRRAAAADGASAGQGGRTRRTRGPSVGHRQRGPGVHAPGQVPSSTPWQSCPREACRSRSTTRSATSIPTPRSRSSRASPPAGTTSVSSVPRSSTPWASAASGL